MKRILLILMLVFIACKGQSQYRWIEDRDSLKYLINTTADDTLKIAWLNNLIILETYNFPDSALKHAQQILSLSTKADRVNDIADANYQLATIYTVLGNFARAIYHTLERKRILDKEKDQLGSVFLASELSDIYYEMGDYKSAYNYMSDAERRINLLPDSFIYKGRVIKKNDDIMYRYTSVASIFLLGGFYDSALYYAQKAFKIDRDFGLYWSQTPLLLGNIYLKLNKIDSALIYYKEPVKIPALKDQVQTNIGIASVFQIKKQTDSAIYFAKKALDTAQTMPYLNGIIKASALLSNLYERSNPQEAINFYKINSATKDSLYSREKANEISNMVFNEERRAIEASEAKKDYSNKIRLVAIISLAGIFLIAIIFLYRNNLNRRKAYVLLTEQKNEIDLQKRNAETALVQLRSAQAQLIQSEKMASLGELTAGIAHEIQNPLNFVNNFSEVNKELVDELQNELRAGSAENAFSISNDIKENEEKINHHGKRADAIVKGMLQHSQSSTGHKEPTDINALADEYLRLSYHGFMAKDKTFNATIQTNFDESIGKINIIPQDIGRVLLNLYNNAFYAVGEKKKQQGESYEPTVSISTKKLSSPSAKGDGGIEIRARDNGFGIPQKVLDKIFQPFFTTKPTGQGTGLGLSLSYDIVKAHGGEIKVETMEGEFAEFVIVLPGVHSKSDLI